MKKILFSSFQVKRFRSLMDVKLDISQETPVIICGENNIGKTNFLRALNLYFNHQNGDIFSVKEDLPYHIYEGSRGANSKTELIGTFLEDEQKSLIKMTFSANSDVLYHLNNEESSAEKVESIIKHFKYIFIESHNVNLPSLIAAILEKDGLLELDKKRSKQAQPLEKLEEFIKLSQVAIADIEKEINVCFEKLTDFDGTLQGKKVKINFVAFEKLRDVVKTMTEITLFDANSLSIASKGSGAQRALFLALMQYVSQNSKQSVIWGIDEPEAFLQPKLQKRVAKVFLDIIKNQNQTILLTTHSQHFINLENLVHTHLFKGKQEAKEYTRRPGHKFFEMNTSPITTTSSFEKATLIKEHLGISGNDGWEVMPHNIIVEGSEDKKYLTALFNISDLPCPNIVYTGGASKIGGYLQFYNSFADDLGYKPKVLCLFDNDNAGREQAKKIKPNSLKNLQVETVAPPRHDGEECNLQGHQKDSGDWEIEDFMPPDLVIKSINTILKKEKYKPITSKQISDRSKSANIKKNILKYASECSGANNPDKEPFITEDEGRKMQICVKVCELLLSGSVSKDQLCMQTAFLKKISS